MPNEHAPEPVVPTPPLRPRSDGGCPASRPGDRPSLPSPSSRGSGCRPSEPPAGGSEPRGQPGCAAGPDRRRRRRLRAGPRGVGPAAREVRRPRHARRPWSAYGAIDGLADAVGDTGHTDFMTPRSAPRATTRCPARTWGSASSSTPPTTTSRAWSPCSTTAPPTRPPHRDVILEVDGVPAAGSSLDDVVERIRGEAGTAVELTVRREDGTPRTLKIVRGEVEIDAVSWTMVPGTTTGLLRIEQFSHGVAEDVQGAPGAAQGRRRRLVLDLRGNPGGYVGEAVGTASQFLSSAPSTSNATPRARRRPRRSRRTACGPTCR